MRISAFLRGVEGGEGRKRPPPLSWEGTGLRLKGCGGWGGTKSPSSPVVGGDGPTTKAMMHDGDGS